MKFRLKITLCMLCLLSLLFGVGGSLLIGLSFRNSLERERLSAYNAYQMVLGTLQAVGSVNGRLESADITRTLEQLSAQNAGAWTALRLYTDEQDLYGYNASALDRAGTSPGAGHCVIRYAPGVPAHTLLLSGALEAGGETLHLDMARDLSPLFGARRAQQRTYQWVFWLLAGLCAVLSYSIAGVLTRPLASLSRASRAIAAGQLSRRARVYSRDEIGLVAEDFNAMAEQLEANISALEDSMERQERFLGSFAHEVKTPMTSIIGYADLIQGQVLSADEQREAAHYIVAEGKRLENLSHKLLDILVLQQGQLTLAPARPTALAQGLALHLRPLYAKQGITLTAAGEEGRCLLDADLVRSLLANLWDNARKAMDGRPGNIHTRVDMLPDGCRILVRDNGRGIPPDALAHLTEAFYRVDKARSRAQGGVGLGLALCREIADLHGGRIRFASKVGQGTAVMVELRGGRA